MDDRRFDALTRRLGTLSSRRSALKALVGLGGLLTTGAVIHGQTDAARRGFSGPSVFPTPTPTPSLRAIWRALLIRKPGRLLFAHMRGNGWPHRSDLHVAEPVPCQVPSPCNQGQRRGQSARAAYSHLHPSRAMLPAFAQPDELGTFACTAEEGSWTIGGLTH